MFLLFLSLVLWSDGHLSTVIYFDISPFLSKIFCLCTLMTTSAFCWLKLKPLWLLHRAMKHIVIYWCFFISQMEETKPPPNTRPPGLLFSRWVKFPGGVCFWRCIIMCSASFMPNFILYLVKDIMIHAHPLTNHHTYVTICSQRPSKRQCTAPPVPSTPLPGPSHCGMDRCSLCFGCDTALKDLFVLSCRTIWVWNMNMKSTLSFFHHLWCQWDALLLYFGEQFTSR